MGENARGGGAIARFFRWLGADLREIGASFAQGDWKSKLSFLVMGFGQLCRGQWVRGLTMLGLDNPPAIYSVTLSGLEKNADGLYPASALENRLQESISAYDAQVAQYSA